MKTKQIELSVTKIALVLSAVLGGAVATPVLADESKTEIEALKHELAEQKELIQRLISVQNSQKVTLEPLLSRASEKTSSSESNAKGSLSVYGVADVSVAVTNSGAGSKASIGSGGMSSSRLGVKGERQFTDDLKAVGLAEAGLLLDTGSAGNASVVPGINNSNPSSGGQLGTGSQLFSRQIYAGVSSKKWGALTLGRQYAGSYIAPGMVFNSMGFGFYGYSIGLLGAIGMPTRVNNSIVYATPNLNGFSGYFTLTPGSENNVNQDTVTAAGATTKTNDKAGRGWDAALFYNNGPFQAALTSWSIYNASYAVPAAGLRETELATKSGFQLGANYDFGLVRIFAHYVSGKTSGGNYENVTKALSKADGWSLSASAPFGQSKVYVSYTALNDKSLLNRDAKLVGVGYSYEVVKNTNFYASWGRLINSSDARYSLPDGGNLVGNVITPGFNPSGFMLGANYQF